MKERKNPTDAQLMRRMRRAPKNCHDPRYKNDAFWALRAMGYSTSYAKRAFRDQLPRVSTHTINAEDNEYIEEGGELLFEQGDIWKETLVAVRPALTQETIRELQPRNSEYTVWDLEVPCFGVRVRASGYKSFVVYYRLRQQKKLRKHTIGNVKEFSLEEARERAREFRRGARMGKDLAKEKKRTADRFRGEL